MKRYLKCLSLFLFYILIFATTGCEEENKNKEALLTAHMWKFDKMETNSTNQDILDAMVFANALLASVGLEWTFDTDGSHTLTATNLDPPESEEGTWELSSDGKTLFIEKGTVDEEEMTIRTLTSDKLVFEEESWDDDLDVYYKVSNHWKK